MISVPPTGSMQTVTVTAAVPPARIIVVDDNLKIKSIASNTKEDVNPKVVLNNIDGKEIKMKMEIAAIRGFSGHSPRDKLLSFVRHLDPKPKKIILVHGENSKCLDLASTLHKIFRVETNAPKNLESIRIR